jgi:hypothetical protein
VKLSLLSLLLVPALCLGTSGSTDIEIDAGSVFALRDSLTLLNPTPHFVSPELAELCIAPPPAAFVAREVERAGPHADQAVNFYVSSDALAAMSSLDQDFPTGTVLIKEKLSASDETATAVGGMVKRPKGFDPENGNWEYFYASRDGTFEMGRISNCVDCHARARTSDHVFGRARNNREARD